MSIIKVLKGWSFEVGSELHQFGVDEEGHPVVGYRYYAAIGAPDVYYLSRQSWPGLKWVHEINRATGDEWEGFISTQEWAQEEAQRYVEGARLVGVIDTSGWHQRARYGAPGWEEEQLAQEARDLDEERWT